jgi:hypothetical protein
VCLHRAESVRGFLVFRAVCTWLAVVLVIAARFRAWRDGTTRREHGGGRWRFGDALLLAVVVAGRLGWVEPLRWTSSSSRGEGARLCRCMAKHAGLVPPVPWIAGAGAAGRSWTALLFFCSVVSNRRCRMVRGVVGGVREFPIYGRMGEAPAFDGELLFRFRTCGEGGGEPGGSVFSSVCSPQVGSQGGSGEQGPQNTLPPRPLGHEGPNGAADLDTWGDGGIRVYHSRTWRCTDTFVPEAYNGQESHRYQGGRQCGAHEMACRRPYEPPVSVSDLRRLRGYPHQTAARG